MTPRRNPIRGFTMMSMLFILVVLAALGAALASLSQRQQLGSAGELATAKAYQAALAGLEWGSFQVLGGGAAQPACFSPNPKNITLGEFTVTINCTRTPATGTVTDGDQVLAFYAVQATACNLASAGACPNAGTTEPTYVERQLSRTLTSKSCTPPATYC